MNRRQRRKAAQANPTDRLRAVNTSREQLRHEFKGVEPTNALPVTYNDVQARDAVVSAPSGRELQLYKDGDRKVCGNCRHFDLETGRKKMIAERLPERLIHEHEWKLRHLGAKLDELGLCGESNGTMVTGFMSKACDHYREKLS